MPPTARQREDRLAANFPERPQDELRGIPLLRPRVNGVGCRKDQKVLTLCATVSGLDTFDLGATARPAPSQVPLMPPEDESVTASNLGFRNL